MNNNETRKGMKKPQLENDPIDEASKESFPASDAPAWIDQDKKDKKVEN